MTQAAGPGCPRIAPIISLTVVLPLLPVMPTTAPGNSPPPCARERGQRRERVGHDDLRRCDRHDDARPAHPRRRALHVGDEVVPVEALAAQRDEQSPRLERARVASRRRPKAALAPCSAPPVTRRERRRDRAITRRLRNALEHAPLAIAERPALRGRRSGSPRGPCRRSARRRRAPPRDSACGSRRARSGSRPRATARACRRGSAR